MKLEIDIGNTRVKWRFVSEDAMDYGSDLVANGFTHMFKKMNLEAMSAILVSSVANAEVIRELQSVCAQFGVQDKLVFAESSREMAGVTFSYEDVSRLGVDRCLAMVAGYKRFPDGVLVIDAGSALTADYVDKTGRHVGGYILPGMQMLKRSLLDGTANVLVLEESDVQLTPGTSTEQCVEHGRYFLCRSLVRGLLDQAEELGINSLAITGGDGLILSRLIGVSDVFFRDLVFEGLECAVSV